MLTVDGVSVRFGERVVLRDAGVQVARGEIVALLGPSGAGKSTLLRVIAGLLVPDAGRVTVDGHDVTNTPPHRRRVGLMFQDEQLFPHLDVEANVGFGLRMQRRPPAQTRARVAELLEHVGLGGFEARRVANLSGGEAKRVALARALAADPAVLLLDEPLTGLDRALHDRLMGDLAALLRAAGTTAVLVTHDHDEAATIAHRTLFLPVWQADGS
jgi:thiamine transport system ATP-binding protein